MNLNHLKYFVDAADLKSCSASAKKNRVSQPALSQSIRNLEADLGYQILKHRPKSFELTQKGEALLMYARRILELVDQARAEVGGTDDLHPIRIICTHSFFKYYLKLVLPEIKRRFPQWEISIAFGDREKIKQSINGGLCDLGFLLTQETLGEFEKQKIRSGYFYEISQASVASEAAIYVTSRKDKEVRKLSSEKFLSKRIVEIGSWESIYELVESNLGSGVVPDYIIRDKKLRKKKIAPYSTLMIAKKTKNSHFSDFSTSLLQALKSEI